MNLSNVFRVIGRHRLLLVFGIIVAIGAALFTGFRLETGTLAPRSQVEYRASTQLLVSDPVSVFSTRSAPQVLTDGTTPAAARDLSALTVVYAYLASSDELLAQVEGEIGELGPKESLTAAQRTTQPTSTTNTGTYRLPILDIMGTSPDPQRAEEISRTAAKLFQAFAAAQQDAAAVSDDARVQLPTIDERAALPVDGTNPMLPVVAVGIGVLLAFIALIFAVDNARASRREQAAARQPIRSPQAAPAGGGMPTGTAPVPVMQVGQPAPAPAQFYRPATPAYYGERVDGPPPHSDRLGSPARS
jgi:hypothetical protein